MTIRSLIATLSICAAASISMAVPSYASDTSVFSREGAWYNVSMNPVVEKEAANRYAKEVLSQDYKCAGSDVVGGFYYWELPAGYACCLPEEGYNRLNSIEVQCNSWLDANMGCVVPQGTPADQIPMLCAEQVAGMMVYDHAALGNYELALSYQCALPCFTQGTGICATYAFAFNAMVSYVPVDPATGLVDYAAASPVHLETGYVSNGSHAWSAILEADGWHHYDVCFYDLSHEARYLNCAGQVWADGDHENAVLIAPARSM